MAFASNLSFKPITPFLQPITLLTDYDYIFSKPIAPARSEAGFYNRLHFTQADYFGTDF